MPIYETLENEYIARTEKDGSVTYIPNDPGNSDYQAYLEHEAQTK